MTRRRPYIAWGRRQLRIGWTYKRDGIDRFRFIGIEVQ